VAEPGETVILQGGGNGVVNGIRVRAAGAVTPSFNEISGLHLRDLSGSCVLVNDVPDVRLISLEATGCGVGAMELHGAQRLTLEGSRIHDNNSTGWTSPVDLYQCRDGNVIRGNWIWSNSDSPVGHADTEGHGIIMDTCGPAGGALIENNVLWNNEGMCLNIYHSDGATIRNNTCHHNGLRSGGGEISSLGNRALIHNNILVPLAGNWALNVRYVDSYAVDPSTLQEDDNLISAQPNDVVVLWGDSAGTLAQYQAQNPRGWGGMDQEADPLFVNAPGGDFHPLSGSPAIDTGDNQHAAAIDIEGRPRPQGVAVDRGAYEYAP
jgi:parallel beta-helix repeat protein